MLWKESAGPWGEGPGEARLGKEAHTARASRGISQESDVVGLSVFQQLEGLQQ